MRENQTRLCTRCGHHDSREKNYPKYGADETPLWVIAARSRCTTCRGRGYCLLEQGGNWFSISGRLTETAEIEAAKFLLLAGMRREPGAKVSIFRGPTPPAGTRRR